MNYIAPYVLFVKTWHKTRVYKRRDSLNGDVKRVEEDLLSNVQNNRQQTRG